MRVYIYPKPFPPLYKSPYISKLQNIIFHFVSQTQAVGRKLQPLSFRIRTFRQICFQQVAISNSSHLYILHFSPYSFPVAFLSVLKVDSRLLRYPNWTAKFPRFHFFVLNGNIYDGHGNAFYKSSDDFSDSTKTYQSDSSSHKSTSSMRSTFCCFEFSKLEICSQEMVGTSSCMTSDERRKK